MSSVHPLVDKELQTSRGGVVFLSLQVSAVVLFPHTPQEEAPLGDDGEWGQRSDFPCVP